MPGHRIPKDDGWRRVTLESVAALGQQVWLRCNACAHEKHLDPIEFAASLRIDPATPLLAIGQRLKCGECGEMRAHCWPYAAYSDRNHG